MLITADNYNINVLCKYNPFQVHDCFVVCLYGLSVPVQPLWWLGLVSCHQVSLQIDIETFSPSINEIITRCGINFILKVNFYFLRI